MMAKDIYTAFLLAWLPIFLFGKPLPLGNQQLKESKSMIDRASDLKPANYIIKPLDESRLYAGILPVIKQVERRLRVEEQLNLDTLLSPTEMQVLQLVAQRKTSKEIAKLLFLSPLTIKNHRHGICRKLNLKEGNNALLMWALKNQDSIGNG